MFTGIVEELGAVRSIDATRLTIRADVVPRDAAVGDSIAVSGTCLTVVAVGEDTLAFELSGETVARTSLSALCAGDAVNLERPATLVSRLGGHLVQGHVDAVGRVAGLVAEAGGGARMRVRIPVELLPFVVEKGSIAFDGVSLTIAALHDDEVEVALIPHTLAATTLGGVGPGDAVNVEVDVVAKYVARQLERLAGDGVVADRSKDLGAGETTDGRERTAWTSA